MATIHISEAEAVRDFAGVLVHIRSGEEVVIENGTEAVAVLRPPAPQRRSISESIARAEAYSKKLGYEPVVDADFAADLEDIIQNRQPSRPTAWD